jgi:hypothetical protein
LFARWSHFQVRIRGVWRIANTQLDYLTFRQKPPYKKEVDVVNRNLMRLASVWWDFEASSSQDNSLERFRMWTSSMISDQSIFSFRMDDYAKIYYLHSGGDKVDYGNVSDRVELRKNLQCTSFKWYLDVRKLSILAWFLSWLTALSECFSRAGCAKPFWSYSRLDQNGYRLVKTG